MLYITHMSKGERGEVNIEIIGEDRRIGIFFDKDIENSGWCYVEKNSSEHNLIMESGEFTVEMLSEIENILALSLFNYYARNNR